MISALGTSPPPPFVQPISIYTLQEDGPLLGGETIGFDSSFSFLPDCPPLVEGVAPNEVATFRFDGSVCEEIRAALDQGDIRIGARVKHIGECADSSVTLVPEPTTSVLPLLGSLLVLRR